MFRADKKWFASIHSPRVHVQIKKETSNIKIVEAQKEKGKTSSVIYDKTIVFIFYYLACCTPMRSNRRSSIRFLIAKISCDVSVNECQGNNTKDITCLMIDRTRKARGLLLDK